MMRKTVTIIRKIIGKQLVIRKKIRGKFQPITYYNNHNSHTHYLHISQTRDTHTPKHVSNQLSGVWGGSEVVYLAHLSMPHTHWPGDTPLPHLSIHLACLGP